MMIHSHILQGFSTLQHEQTEQEDTIDTVCDDNIRSKKDKLSMLYAKAAKRQDMNFQEILQIHMHLEHRTMSNSTIEHGVRATYMHNDMDKNRKATEFF